MKNIKKKVGVALLVGTMSLSLTGCFAGWGNTKAVHGGYFTSDTGKYVVINESGGQIMDVWILKDSYVKSEQGSDGATVVDEDGNGIIIQGDVKVIRDNGNLDLNKYTEYHKEINLIPYEEYFKANKK
jgi:hypothetical protein